MEAGGGDVVQQFINAIPEAVLAGAGQGAAVVQEMLGTNAASIVGQAAFDITALIERMSSLESTVRANSQHDQDVLTSRTEQVEALRVLHMEVFKFSTQVELLKDAVVSAERERRKDFLAAEKERQSEEQERQREARLHRASRRADSRRFGRIREALVALTKQTEDSGNNVASSIAEQTTAMCQFQPPTKVHTIPPESSQASASYHNPAAAPTPPEPLRRGLRLQRGGRKGTGH